MPSYELLLGSVNVTVFFGWSAGEENNWMLPCTDELLMKVIFKRVLIGNQPGDLRIELNQTYQRILESGIK